MLNVRDFGAHGAGGDDTAAFEAAFAQLDALSFVTPGGQVPGGSKLVVPAGVYRITRPLKVPFNSVIEGEGVMSLLLFNDGNWQNGPYFGSGLIASRLANQNGPGCTIRDIAVGNENPNNANGAGIDCIGGGLIHIENVTTYAWRFHIVLDGTELSTIEGCNFTAFGAPTDYPQHPPEGTAYNRHQPWAVGIWFCGDRSLTVPSRGVTIIDGTNANWVRNCQFNGPDVHLWHQAGVSNSVRDCNFESAGHTWVSGCNQFTLDHCLWSDIPAGDEIRLGEIILIDSPGVAAAVGLRIVDNVFFSSRPALRITPNTVVLGLDFSYNFCGTHRPEAVIEAAGVDVAGPTIAIGNQGDQHAEMFSNEVGADGCILYASQCGAGTNHRSVGVGTVKPQARFDVRRMGDEQGIVERVGNVVEKSIPEP